MARRGIYFSFPEKDTKLNFACHFAFNYSNTPIHPLTHIYSIFICTGDYTVHRVSFSIGTVFFLRVYRFFDHQFSLLSLLPFHFIKLQFSSKLKANGTTTTVTLTTVMMMTLFLLRISVDDKKIKSCQRSRSLRTGRSIPNLDSRGRFILVKINIT